MGYNVANATKNISCTKGEDAVDQSTVTRWFKKFCLGCKSLIDQARPAWILRLCFMLWKQILQMVLRGYQVSLVSHSPSAVCHFHNLSKNIWAAELYLTISKYCKTFGSTKYYLHWIKMNMQLT